MRGRNPNSYASYHVCWKLCLYGRINIPFAWFDFRGQARDGAEARWMVECRLQRGPPPVVLYGYVEGVSRPTTQDDLGNHESSSPKGYKAWAGRDAFQGDGERRTVCAEAP